MKELPETVSAPLWVGFKIKMDGATTTVLGTTLEGALS
jgi:hypothetical protein